MQETAEQFAAAVGANNLRIECKYGVSEMDIVPYMEAPHERSLHVGCITLANTTRPTECRFVCFGTVRRIWHFFKVCFNVFKFPWGGAPRKIT